MNTRFREIVICLLAINSLVSGCSPRQFFSPTPTFSPTYVALNVDDYQEYTVYWKRVLWESVVSAELTTEDFETDGAEYGELGFPYLTGTGFMLEGKSAAQILADDTLLQSGNLLHVRDWQGGLKVSFPNSGLARAFCLDYVTSQEWQVAFKDFVIILPPGRRGFVGIVLDEGFAEDFVLSSAVRVQGGLSVDNISYDPTNSP